MAIYINCKFLSQNITGVQRFALEISLAIKKLNSDIVFLAPSKIKHTAVASQLSVLSIGKGSGYYWEQVELPLWLRKNDSEALLINLCNLAPAFHKNNVLVLHDIAFLSHPEWFSKKFLLVYKNLIPFIVKRAKRILTVSFFSKSEIIKYFDLKSDHVNVVYNAVSYLPEGNISGRKLDKPFLLAVSSISPRKNFKKLIQAFLQLDNDLELVLAGELNKSFADTGINIPQSKLDKIRFLGYVSDKELSQLYKTALAFVYPSLYEGFGIPPLEAMSMGCPVIVSNTSSLPEVCKNAALYVDPENVEQIKEAIMNLYNHPDLAKSMVEKGYQVIKEYSWEKSATKLLEVVS